MADNPYSEELLGVILARTKSLSEDERDEVFRDIINDLIDLVGGSVDYGDDV